MKRIFLTPIKELEAFLNLIKRFDKKIVGVFQGELIDLKTTSLVSRDIFFYVENQVYFFRKPITEIPEFIKEIKLFLEYMEIEFMEANISIKYDPDGTPKKWIYLPGKHSQENWMHLAEKMARKKNLLYAVDSRKKITYMCSSDEEFCLLYQQPTGDIDGLLNSKSLFSEGVILEIYDSEVIKERIVSGFAQPSIIQGGGDDGNN